MEINMIVDALAQYLKEMFKGFGVGGEYKYYNRDLDQTIHDYPDVSMMKIFTYETPPNNRKGDNDNTIYPFALIRPESGEANVLYGAGTATISILFGCRSDSEDMQGMRDICNMIDRFVWHVSSQVNRIVKKKYVISHELAWATHEEDCHPYYYGGVIFKVNVRTSTESEELV